jgi:hypothetical protein
MELSLIENSIRKYKVLLKIIIITIIIQGQKNILIGQKRN